MKAYTFMAEAGDSIKVRVLDAANGGYLQMYSLYEPGSLPSTGFPYPTLSEGNTYIRQGGIHTLLVGSGSNVPGSYTIFVQRNTNPVGASLLNLDGLVTGTVAIAPAMGGYTFTAQANDIFAIRVLNRTDAATPRLEVWESGPDSEGIFRGQICGEGYPGYGPLVIAWCKVNRDGVFSLLVGEISDLHSFAYSVYLQRLNNPANTVPITYNVAYNGAIVTAPRLQTYSFSGGPNESIRLRIEDTGGAAFYPEARISDGQGYTVCSVEADNTSAEIPCTLRQAGSYTVTVGDWGGAYHPSGGMNTGTFRLTLLK